MARLTSRTHVGEDPNPLAFGRRRCPVTYVFMAIHYPEPGRQAELYRRMADMARSLAGAPGLMDIGPWVEHDGERVVGISRWESREAFEGAMPGSGVPSDTVHEWEARPREYLHLAQPAP
jgi:hypothetical protein